MSPRNRRRSAALLAALVISLLPPQPTAHATESVAATSAASAVAPAALPQARAKTGNLKVTITGLPKKAKAKVVVNGAGKQRKVTKSKTFKKLAVFVYEITVSDVKHGKWWYRGVGQTTTAAVRKGKTAKVKIRYTKASSPTPTPTPPKPAAVRFNLANSVAVGLASNSSITGSAVHSATVTANTNLVAVKSDNTVVTGVSSGTLLVNQERVGPDGSVYLALSQWVVLDGDTQSCALVRVRPGDTRGECVDYSIGAVTPMQLSDLVGVGNGNATLQFDAAGNVYYLATKKPTGMAGSAQGIFRNSAGAVYNLTPAGVTPTDFLVIADGSVLISGSTAGSQWVRKISPTGSVTNLTTQVPPFMRAFSDGNVYFSRTSYNDLARYLPETGALDPMDWVGPCDLKSPRDAHYWCSEIVDAVGGRPALENVALTGPRALVNLADGQAMSPLTNYSAKDSPSQGWIVCYYPVPALFRTTITWPTTAVAAANDLVVAGAVTSGGQRLIAFDARTHTERTLLDGQVTITHLVYSAPTNSVRFSGTQLANGAPVIGSVDLTSGAVGIVVSAVALLDLEGM